MACKDEKGKKLPLAAVWRMNYRSAEVLLLFGLKMLLASEAFGQGGCLAFWIPGPLVLQDWVTKTPVLLCHLQTAS